jgi:hypothetical protein
VAGCCGQGNESSGSIKWGEFVDKLRTYSFPRTLSSMEFVS